ncbi:ferredoxin [Sphaerisporangium aureirubrum]|uniref:Ferredoxin n=1 Tax=Sphaerisporangium aureirubrum TaxID=1544736 RepID=A0ABW1NR03_9ACTN
MRLRVDQESCCGSGMCALVAPDVFDQDTADGRVVLLDASPPPALHDAVRHAIHACPCGVIGEDAGPGTAV